MCHLVILAIRWPMPIGLCELFARVPVIFCTLFLAVSMDYKQASRFELQILAAV